MDSLFFKEHFVKISNFFLKRLNRFPKISVQLKFIGASPNSEHLGLFWSYLPHPTLESCIVFFYGLFILQGTFYQNFKIFLNRLDQLASGSTGSSSQLIWSTDFGNFGAQFLHGLGPWAPDQFWAVFWIHFGPYFGILAAHHESLWILGEEASGRLKIVSLHGKWGGELMGKLIPRLTGALSKAWRREKQRGFDG